MNRDSRIIEINLEKIVPNRFQPRKTFNEDISELAESIRAHGVLQPITVRPLGEKFEIVMGERRYRACEKLGMQKIPCMVVEMNDREAMEVALIENLQRQDLNPIEEALSYKRILEAGYVTQEQLAQRIGKSQSTIANKLRLLSLDKEVQEALLKNEISERHARSLLRLENKELQKLLLKRIIAEKLTVKKTDEEIRKMEKSEIVNQKKDTLVEIIDFDDNPFRDPIPEFKNENISKNIVEENIDEIPEFESISPVESDALKTVEFNNNSVIKSEKPKPSVPSLGIIDDLEDGNKNIEIESNHGFNSNFEVQNEVSLENIEPDELEFEELPEENKVSFDEMIENKTDDFDQIKFVIEKCQKDLTALGYKVTLEKFDFETTYQLIFNINKK